MAVLQLSYRSSPRGDEWLAELTRADFIRFNPTLLSLGDLSAGGRLDVLAAVFDLEGFTTFCSQTDPDLVVPDYLRRFLTWLFEAVANECRMEERNGDVLLWNRLPHFAKFLGDGVLFLWETQSVRDNLELGNIVKSLHAVCGSYPRQFLRSISSAVIDPPTRLRCGVARGQVVAIGEGNDYVGPCINLAARLQKLGGLRFAVGRRGLDPTLIFGPEWQHRLMARRVAIRGVAWRELVLVEREEYETLSEAERALFLDPDGR